MSRVNRLVFVIDGGYEEDEDEEEDVFLQHHPPKIDLGSTGKLLQRYNRLILRKYRLRL